MITQEVAWNIITRTITPLPVSPHPLNRCLHHILAEAVKADRDVPAADRSAMDGFAVRGDDITKPATELKIVGEVPAGSDAAPSVGPGECVLIYTGANLPPDTDTIVRVENTTPAEDASITVIEPIKKGADRFRKGENASKGDTLIPAGTQLTPAHIGICAQTGCAKPVVHKHPAISILVTGEELKTAGEKVELHQIRDSNGPTLQAMLKANHFKANSSTIVNDDLKTTSTAISALLDTSDFIIITGGVSVGTYDYVPDAIKKAGGTVKFHGVAMQPGKPQLFAEFPGNKFVFGLPGNPLSVMTGFHEFILPALKILSGMPVDKCHESLELPLKNEANSKGRRKYYALGRLIQGTDGYLIEPIKRKGSADLITAGKADGVFAIPLGTKHLDPGSIVKFTPWVTERRTHVNQPSPTL